MGKPKRDWSADAMRPGEIWAASGADAAALSAWCRAVAADAEGSALVSFGARAALAGAAGWLQARYHGDCGETVADALSFDSVYDVNPFAVGVRYPETRRRYKERLADIVEATQTAPLLSRPVAALSNGETKRLQLALALAARPRIAILDDPAGGLDPAWRDRLKKIVLALSAQGTAVVFAYRHLDELPDNISGWLHVGKSGRARMTPPPKAPSPPPLSLRGGSRVARTADGRRTLVRAAKASEDGSAPAVLEIRDLTLEIGGRMLLKDFSWTVRRGERWILRGGNGSGKTTLLALVAGDSPLAYAMDITLFGHRRGDGFPLRGLRRRLGVVSPELQAFEGLSSPELAENALKKDRLLLLLDEPFMNLDPPAARRLSRRICGFLEDNPSVAAILVCHRDDEAPPMFDREMRLG